jgi:hypothetical protein
VPDDVSALYVPLRSNAKTLMTGGPIAAMRRRLKYASVFHDRVLLESGFLRMHAGAGGSFNVVLHPAAGEPVRWQTPRERHLAQQTPFQLAVGREITPGVSAEVLHPVLESDSEISWSATPPAVRHRVAGRDGLDSLWRVPQARPGCR